MEVQPVRYDVFISYSHSADEVLATHLQNDLAQFSKDYYKQDAIKIFRDRTNISAGGYLSEAIEEALINSRFLILLASPEAARSEWVNKEVAQFKKTHEPDSILILLLRGGLAWDDAGGDFDWLITNAIPSGLRNTFHKEPHFMDLRGHKVTRNRFFRSASYYREVARIVSHLKDETPDLVVLHFKEKKKRQLIVTGFISFASLLLMLLLMSARNNLDLQKQLSTEFQKNAIIESINASLWRHRISRDSLLTVSQKTPLIATFEEPSEERFIYNNQFLIDILYSSDIKEISLNTDRDKQYNGEFDTEDKTLLLRDSTIFNTIVFDTDKPENDASPGSFMTGTRYLTYLSNMHRKNARSNIGSSEKLEWREVKQNSVQIYNQRGRLIDQLPVSFETLTSLQGYDDNLVTVSIGEGVSFWNLETLDYLYTLGSRGSISATFSPDRSFLAIGYFDGFVEIWNVKDRRAVSLFRHGPPVHKIYYTDDGTYILTENHEYNAPPVATFWPKARVWLNPVQSIDIASEVTVGGSKTRIADSGWNYLNAGYQTMLSNNGSFLVTNEGDDIRVWDTETGNLTFELNAVSKNNVVSATLVDDNQFFYVKGHLDKITYDLFKVDLTQKTVEQVSSYSDNTLKHALLTKDGLFLLMHSSRSGNIINTIKQRTITSEEVVKEYSVSCKSPRYMLTNYQRTLAIFCKEDDQTYYQKYILYLETGAAEHVVVDSKKQIEQRVNAANERFEQSGFSYRKTTLDRQFIVGFFDMGAGSPNFTVVDAKDFNEVVTSSSPDCESSPTFSNSGKYIVYNNAAGVLRSSSENAELTGKIEIFERETARTYILKQDSWSAKFAFNIDESLIASLTVSGILQIWNISDGSLINSFRIDDRRSDFDYCHSTIEMYFSPDSRSIYLGIPEHKVQIWRLYPK